MFLVSRRSSRSYSHQTFVQYTPKGVFGYRTQTYSETDHFYTPNNMNYYQPNQYHYHSTPWRYRWGRSAEEEPRDKRAADPKLAQISNLRDVPANTISKLAENVSIAYQPDVWTNDMIFKVELMPVDLLGNPDNLQDQDDCSKRLLCELNAKKAGGESITENEEIIAASYGKSDSIDISAESLEFDIAAVLGRVVSSVQWRKIKYQAWGTLISNLISVGFAGFSCIKYHELIALVKKIGGLSLVERVSYCSLIG